MSKTTETHYFTFGDNFETKFAKDVVKHPDITLIELVSNSWDAGATEVKIQWPIIDSMVNGEIFTIRDNGHGMTKDEFFRYWRSLGIDKRKNVGKEVILENGVKRKILGRNGKGRLGLFGFSSRYEVITCKDNKKESFSVKKTKETGQYGKLIHESTVDYEGDDSGTYIKCPIHDNYLGLDEIETELSTRFGADSNFRVYLNDKEIKLLDLASFEKKSCDFHGNKIEIVQIPRERYNKKLSQYQIVWWVNQKSAETNKWRDLGIPLDGTNKIENKFVFCIVVDFLENHVKSDWTGFEETQEVEEVKNFVKEELLKITKDFIKESHHEKKLEVVKKTKEHLKNLNPITQKDVGNFIDEVLEKTSITVGDLSKIVSILVTMEESNRKLELLDKFVEMDNADWDKIGEILDKWSIEDAYTVLGELYWRLELISKLEDLVDDIKTNELKQLQPLFQKGLWMFGPEYEGTTNFTSNRSLRTALREVLGVDTKFEGSNKRPDFVATPQGDIWDIYGSDRLKNSKVVGYRKILLIELKKGNSTISYKEMAQAVKYVKKIKGHGKLQKDTEIECFVLGSKVDNENKEEERVGKNAIVYPFTYDTIIRNAKQRTLNLKDKITDVKGITDIGDPEINEVINKNRSQETFVSH